MPDLDNKPPTGWTIYEVADSELVVPLAYQPVVVDGMHEDPNWKCEGKPPPPAGTKADELGAWECTAVPWFDDPTALDRPLTADGPDSWQHATQENARTTTKKALPPVTVSNIHSTDDSIEFDVSRTGVPVMVRASYFPNWEVEGATGPVPGDAELHGGRAHEQAREAGVRHHHRRMGGPGRHRRSASSGWGCWSGGAGMPARARATGAPTAEPAADEDERGPRDEGSPGNRRRKRSTVRLRSP